VDAEGREDPKVGLYARAAGRIAAGDRKGNGPTGMRAQVPHLGWRR
jgi:hypothetical protein